MRAHDLRDWAAVAASLITALALLVHCLRDKREFKRLDKDKEV